MNIFSSSPAKKYHDEARKALQEGNPQQGLSQLTFGFCADPSHKPLYELAISCLQQFEGTEEEVDLFKVALSHFDDPHAFYDLGYHFIDVGHDRLAIPFLERAHRLDPSAVEVATELAIAYAGEFQPRKGRDVLAQVSYQEHFWAAYQYYWCSLLCNETEGVEDYIKSARRDIQQSTLDTEVTENCMTALDKLDEVLQRLVMISKPKPIIQHWHFIQYGSAVLDYFDDRVDPDGLSVAGGRWVATWGSMGQVISIIRKLELFLKELDQHPRVVLGLPDRDSQIISHAVAQVLGIPYEEVTENNIAQPDSLVVTADNRQIVHPELEEVLENQTLFSFNLHWLSDASCTPDVVGLMTQTYVMPWAGGHMRVDPKTQEVTTTEPDARPAPEIVQELVSTEAVEDPRFAEIMDFYKKVKPYLKGARNGSGRRLPFRTDSPIPGARFC